MCRISVYVVDQKSEIKDFLHSTIYSAMIVGYEKVMRVTRQMFVKCIH
jgi:hypothetical protein